MEGDGHPTGAEAIGIGMGSHRHRHRAEVVEGEGHPTGAEVVEGEGHLSNSFKRMVRTPNGLRPCLGNICLDVFDNSNNF